MRTQDNFTQADELAQNTSRKKYRELLLATIAKIDEIDQQTPCSSTYPNYSPDWWLEMMDLRGTLQMMVE